MIGAGKANTICRNEMTSVLVTACITSSSVRSWEKFCRPTHSDSNTPRKAE